MRLPMRTASGMECVTNTPSGRAREKAAIALQVKDLAAGGMTLLVIEHHMTTVMTLCERILVLNFGSLVTAQGEGRPRCGPAARTRAAPRLLLLDEPSHGLAPKSTNCTKRSCGSTARGSRFSWSSRMRSWRSRCRRVRMCCPAGESNSPGSRIDSSMTTTSGQPTWGSDFIARGYG